MIASELIIGGGEVGSALAEVLDCPIRDIEPTDVTTAYVLHIAYPWHDDFVQTTLDYQNTYSADLIIIHSTVPVGTCDSQGWVHSPVRGRHPNLVQGLWTFVKFFGGKRSRDASLLWPGLSKAVDRASDTEAAKLWELAQFGIQVRITQAIYEWCEENGLDPDIVYRQMADTYNWGYQSLGEPQFTRPVLDYVPGPIGGHCVAQNSSLIDHPLIEIIYE